MKDRRKSISKLKKQDFEYGISDDPTDLQFFYRKIYIPYVTERYQDRARIISDKHEFYQSLFERKAKLLYVNYQSNLVAANSGVLRRYGRTFSALHMGVDQDYTHLLQQDVVVALYWHVINWARAQQFHFVDFGRTRARLNDGVFEFKRRWGMQFERDVTTYTMWTFIGENLPASLVSKINDLAFVAEVGKEYRCLVLVDDESSLPDKELARRKKITAQAGLDGILILQPD